MMIFLKHHHFARQKAKNVPCISIPMENFVFGLAVLLLMSVVPDNVPRIFVSTHATDIGGSR